MDATKFQSQLGETLHMEEIIWVLKSLIAAMYNPNSDNFCESWTRKKVTKKGPPIRILRFDLGKQ